MRDIVRERFYDVNDDWEGTIDSFYQDVKGLVSIGVGILADPIRLAMGLPMLRPDGTPASANEIAAEWAKVKALGSGTKEQGNPAAINGWRFARPHTRLRLSKDGLRDTLLGKLHLHDLALAKHFPDWETWPADAQMALHNWAWGVGPAAPYPKMFAALRARKFRAAAEEIKILYQRADGTMEEISGLVPRNRANRALLINAAFVDELGLDPDVLIWPRNLETDPLDPEDETQPNHTPSARPAPSHHSALSRMNEALEAAREFPRDFNDPDDEPPKAA